MICRPHHTTSSVVIYTRIGHALHNLLAVIKLLHMKVHFNEHLGQRTLTTRPFVIDRQAQRIETSTIMHSVTTSKQRYVEQTTGARMSTRGVNRYPKFWNSDSNRQPTRNSVGHQQIYRTDFGTTPKDLTSRAINLHYYFRVVLKTLSCSVYVVL